MPIIFEESTRCFHLSNDRISYILRLTAGAYPLHLYWGRRVRTVSDDLLSRLCPYTDESFSLHETPLDLLPQELKKQGLSPVGRLDKDTEGLLLLTNDGALTHRLLSPKSHVDKVYFARTEGTPTEADAARLAQGIALADGLHCLPAELKICGEGQVLLTLREGKFHQAKRMLASCGTPVVYLKRLSMGPLHLGEDLRPGEFRHLTQEEITKLQQAAGLVAADCQKKDNNFCEIHKKPLANP